MMKWYLDILLGFFLLISSLLPYALIISNIQYQNLLNQLTKFQYWNYTAVLAFSIWFTENKHQQHNINLSDWTYMCMSYMWVYICTYICIYVCIYAYLCIIYVLYCFIIFLLSLLYNLLITLHIWRRVKVSCFNNCMMKCFYLLISRFFILFFFLFFTRQVNKMYAWWFFKEHETLSSIPNIFI